jgi:hypothetical protein
MKYYVVGVNDETDPYVFESKLTETHWGPYIAQDAAQDFFDNHDGTEDAWPLVFVLLRDDGTEFSRCKVGWEAVPQFWAYPMPPKSEKEPV